MATLSPSELKKRNNWKTFLEKIETGSPFVLDRSKKNIVVGFPDQKETIRFVKALKKLGVDAGLNARKESGAIVLPTQDGKGVKLNHLHKSVEFGSSGRTGTEKEDIALEEFNEAIRDIMKRDKLSAVPIKVGRRNVKIVEIVSTPGTPKSDFHGIDINGKEVAWFSHKDGSRAKDFQQWGGMTEQPIKTHPLIKDFIKTVQKKFPTGIPRATTVARKIKLTGQGRRLHDMSVYGVDAGKGPGRQNVDVLIQGPITLKKQGSIYVIKSNHVHYNGEIMTGDFVPVLMAIYKGDRSNFDVKGARFAIQPLGSRRITEFV